MLSTTIEEKRFNFHCVLDEFEASSLFNTLKKMKKTKKFDELCDGDKDVFKAFLNELNNFNLPF